MYLRLVSKYKNSLFTPQNFQRFFKRTLKTEEEKKVTDEPVQYSTSGAGKWKAKYSTSGKEYFTTPSIQPSVIVFSLACFLIYFCMLREENDWDDWLSENETKVPLRMEEARLRTIIEDRKKSKQSTAEYEAKLQEVLERKKAEIAR